MELFPVPLLGGALSLDGIVGSCVPQGAYVSCFLMGSAVIPPGLLFGLGLLSADGCGQSFPEWPPPEKGKLLSIPESFASHVLPSQQATFTPVSQEVLQEIQSGVTWIPVETLLCPWTQCP